MTHEFFELLTMANDGQLIRPTTEKQNMKSKLEKYTIGTWSVSEFCKTRVVDSLGEMVADTVSRYRPCFEAESNARLIAAAPDLLSACQLAYDELAKMGCECGEITAEPECPVCACHRAILKATEGK